MRPSETEIDDSRLLMDVARAVLAREEARAWTVEPGDFWCLLTPPGHRSAGQGWKLHLSATQLSAPVVLARAAEVLVRDGCAFKFARGLEQLGMLLSANCDRGGGGKFITVYPGGDEQFRRLAAELDRVTTGLPGPVVLSDRPLRPGSLVHYRYGVFAAEPVLTNDGNFESMVVGPDGERRKDERLAWYDPPPWARPPLPEPDAPSGVPEAVLVGDRFEVREAVRQSYRGGVYSGTDRRSGGDVVLKQARPHVLGLLDGTDARDRLRHEADMLDRLGPLGFTPRKVTMVTQQDNLFLVQERVPGVTLREWATREPAAEDVIEKAGQLVEIVAAVHEQGLVLRDLNPNNLMVTPEGRVRLIDLELVVPEGSRAYRAYTQGYAAPEQVSAAAIGPAPTRRADLFGLGATLVYLATAVDPLLAPDEPADRRGEGRLAEFVGLLGADMPVLRRLSPLVLGLTKDDPEQRWTLSRAREFLAADPAEVLNTFSPPIDRLITDGLRHILRTMDPRGARLWTTDEFGAATDPLNVQHGAGGVLSVLTRGAQVLGQAELLAGVADVAGWMRPRLSGIPRLLPGLYFGRSGTAWALYDAARLLGDEETAAQAVELAKKVPVRWPNHDICHGATGAGLLQLHLWRTTGDPELMDRFTQAADGVLEAAREREDGLLVWPIPKTFDTTLAGLVHYGFAHGVAGAGTFMLYAGLATGRAEYLEAARRAAETVAAVAITEGDAAWWPSGELADEADDRLRHWCSGASGAGTFLIRSWAVTGRQRHRELAEAAATAIRRGRWHSGVSSCHGLSGDGDFLLDLAEFTGDRRYRDWAADLATAMYARNTLRDGLMVLPDDSGVAVHTGYNTGLGGAVSFLLRLRHGGPRPWMLDELLLDRALRAPHGRLVHAGRSMTAVSEGR